MKQLFIFIAFVLFINASAQVGIGNTNPQASLDITANNVATPSNTDGILIPRIDDFPVTNPGASQDGMMVFVTGNGTPTKGFYYWDNAITTWVTVIGTQNTLDQAYDEGGLGAGKNIDASNGALRINGTDGLLVTGAFNSGNSIDTEVTGAGVRMFFNPRTGAFRSGQVLSNKWDSSRIGAVSFATNYDTQASGARSFATGSATLASGLYSFSGGLNSIASGVGSTTFGIHSEAPSWGEFTIGLFPTTYSVPNNWTFVPTERVFTVGNGTGTLARSNALTIYKSGLININEEYNLPLTDGTNGQAIVTDGAGNLSFQNPIGDGDTQNTLNQAYNEGGAGAGRDIIASDGAVSISGEDGFEITGTFGSGADLTLTGSGTRLFFNPKKAAFRAGYAIGGAWNNTNVGNYSFASNYNTSAEGEASFSANSYSTASGRFSASFGRFSEAFSYTEMAIGSYPTTYAPANANAFNIADRAFVIGNSTTTVSRSNAFEVWKDGRVIINEAYTLPTSDGANNQVLTTDGAGNITFQDSVGDGDTQNTLDGAYDEGGAGLGKNIFADAGSVRINGDDGFLVTGTLGSGNTIDTEITGSGTRMFFNPNKAAFRAGGVSGSQWNNTNLGLWSIGFGANTTASGTTSTAFGSGTVASGNSSTSFGVDTNATGSNSTTFGQLTTASGSSSTSFGVGTIASGSYAYVSGSFNTAPSFAETVMGTYATNYTPVATGAFNSADKLFVIGNGTTSALRSNALTIFKSGLMNINDAYNMPLTDGTSGQVLTTDGAGSASWQDNTTPTLALARITMQVGQNVSSPSKLNFNTVDFDLNSNFNTTTDRFVVSTAGYYRISGQYSGSTDEDFSEIFVFDITVNGSFVRRTLTFNYEEFIITQSVSSVMYLNVNDYIELELNPGQSVSVSSLPERSYFEIEQIR
ncbi:hypothetical protein [Psychroserpens sp.]|uniref:hypothetical protein n=1 Tax=Psychroserpens sp. TaxID=2020870 RepID=UPI002B2798ED|nr:hypothetical protein [Psychroserpens sp.]